MNRFPPPHGAAAAAVAAAAGFGGIAGFQVALAAGAPWGRAAWGGAHARLSTAQRTGSAVAVVVWTAAAITVPGRSGLGPAGRFAPRLGWAPRLFGAASAIGALMNFASQSRWENRLWAPLALLLAILCTVVARSSAGNLGPDAA